MHQTDFTREAQSTASNFVGLIEASRLALALGLLTKRLIMAPDDLLCFLRN